MDMTRFARWGPRGWGLTVALVLTAAVGGCGGDGICPVEGQVVWKDGTPAKELAGSQVIFNLPEKQTSARGSIQADGSFRLTTKKPDDGALAGDYKVLILEVGRKPLGGPDSTLLAPGVLDSRYSDPSTTDLKVTVKPGTNQITLAVERNRRR
jgi:hypothetical protein